MSKKGQTRGNGQDRRAISVGGFSRLLQQQFIECLGNPAGHVQQVEACEGGRVEVGAQVVAGFADQNEASSTPSWLTDCANASARRIAVAGSWQPSSGFHRMWTARFPRSAGRTRGRDRAQP